MLSSPLRTSTVLSKSTFFLSTLWLVKWTYKIHLTAYIWPLNWFSCDS